MRTRHLFQAYDGDELVHIDSLDDKNKTLLCPHCRNGVVARQGEKNIWHFAHKTETCMKSFPILDDGKNEQLDSYEMITAEFEVPEDPTWFMCVKCRQKKRKEKGIKYAEKEYICRNCYGLM